MVQNNFDDGINILKNDEYFNPIISSMDIPIFPKESDYFQSLIKFIIYQQLSIKAARKIYMRFLLLFKETKINPENFKKISHKNLRNVGISKSKIKYMHEVANSFVQNNDLLNNIDSLSDEEIIIKLTKIKGIGPWTADMFLMFTLHRLDIFPIKDLGIKKGMKKLFKLDYIPTDEFMIKESKRWSPYRTICCLYLWKLIDGNNFEW